MADTNQNSEPNPEIQAHNAEVAQKLAAQDISGQNMAPQDTGDASDALDTLLKKAEADKAAVPPAKTDAEVAAEKAAAEEAAKKAAQDAEAADAAKKKADEYFKDAPALPTGTSPKASEAFSSIKIKAAQEISAREAELDKLRKEHAELQEKLKNTAPPEAIKELEDHRAWRAKLDIEADPKWKQFDKDVDMTREFIYTQLKRSPVITPEVIAEIKKHGGPENVKMDSIFSAIKDPALQRTIESKLADIEQRKFEKGRAIEEAKTNISEYLANRSKEAVDASTRHNALTEEHFGKISQGLDWFKERTADPKATEADKKSVEEHNTKLKTIREQLGVAMKDDSPEMRAIMLAGMGQLFHLQPIHKATLAELEATKKSLADLTVKFEKLKSGSLTRLRESNASPDATPPAPKKDDFATSAGDALDNLRRQVTEERERAAAAGK